MQIAELAYSHVDGKQNYNAVLFIRKRVLILRHILGNCRMNYLKFLVHGENSFPRYTMLVYLLFTGVQWNREFGKTEQIPEGVRTRLKNQFDQK